MMPPAPLSQSSTYQAPTYRYAPAAASGYSHADDRSYR